jgi:hypothetical protein
MWPNSDYDITGVSSEANSLLASIKLRVSCLYIFEIKGLVDLKSYEI